MTDRVACADGGGTLCPTTYPTMFRSNSRKYTQGSVRFVWLTHEAEGNAPGIGVF